MKMLLILVIFMTTTVQAQTQESTINLPPGVATIDEIVDEFRGTLIEKMGELGKNFISQTKDNTIVFSNSTDLKCNGEKTNVGQPVSAIQYSFKKTSKNLSEKIVYIGCNNLVSVVEEIYTEGSDLKPSSFNDVIKGKRSFDLEVNQSKKVYRVSNSDNEEMFKMVVQKMAGQNKIAEFFITENKFLALLFEYTSQFSRLTFKYPGYSGQYVRKYSSWSFSARYEPFSNTVLAQKNSSGSIDNFYFDTRGARLSQADFFSRVSSFLFQGPLARIRSFLDYHNFYFPTTETVQSSGQNERLKEELRLAFNRLQNNIELNLVKKQIQDYIEAVENGFIKDSRPKE
jgi:hypothetical protein